MIGHWYVLFLCLCASLFCNAKEEEPATTKSTDVQRFSIKKKSAEKTPVAQKVVDLIRNEKKGEQAKGEKSPEQPGEGTIYFNFDNASLTTVLNYLVERKNLDVIPHKDLLNIKVSLVSREPMTLDEAWETVLILMEANNFTLVNVNGVHRVVPLTANQQNPLPCYSSLKGIEPEKLPDSNVTTRYIYFCKNLKVDVARDILTPMLSDKAVQINSTLQACILTDNCNYIKAAMRIIKELDVNGMRQNIKIMPLRHTNADQVAKLLNEQIIQGQQQDNSKIRIIGEEKKREMTFFSKDTKIFSEPMHNRLIFMGMEDAINKIINFINKHIDVPLESARSRLHIKELKYYTAANMKELLDPIITPPRGLGGATGLVEGEYKFFQDVTITPEMPSGGNNSSGSGNRLVIACNPEDWQRLSNFIDQVDKPQPQVAVEIMIVDVEISDDMGLGGNARLPNGMLGNNVSAGSYMLGEVANTAPNLTSPNVLNNILLETGSSIISFGNASSNEVWGVIRSWCKTNHSNIISQPYVVTNNNVKGFTKSSVTHQIPTVQTNNSTQPVQIDQPQSADILAEVTPHVNASGIIKLEVHITVNEFTTPSDSASDKTNREITTIASMAAGEVLVLGGLTSSEHATSNWSVPLLGSIPILGTLFSSKNRNEKKSNLYIFIRPTVLKPHFGFGADEYTQLKLDYAKYQVVTSDDACTSQDPIKRYMFAPRTYNLKQKALDAKAGRMPIIDDFAERRRMPNEVEMAKDPYFNHISETSDIAYEPEEGFASMPHLDPDQYATPGLFESLLSDIPRSRREEQVNEPSLAQRQSSLRTTNS